MEDIDTYTATLTNDGNKFSMTTEDMEFLVFAKAHRPCWFRQFERLQARDAKNAEKAKATVPDEV